MERFVAGDSRNDFQIVFVTAASKRWVALRISDHSPQSHSAVIVRHRIVKPRFDDELAALNDPVAGGPVLGAMRRP